jgi:hypothetical protein
MCSFVDLPRRTPGSSWLHADDACRPCAARSAYCRCAAQAALAARLVRLEVVIAMMLARERRRHADTEAGGCTELAAALAALPSRPLEKVADSVVALDCADA